MVGKALRQRLRPVLHRIVRAEHVLPALESGDGGKPLPGRLLLLSLDNAQPVAHQDDREQSHAYCRNLQRSCCHIGASAALESRASTCQGSCRTPRAGGTHGARRTVKLRPPYARHTFESIAARGGCSRRTPLKAESDRFLPRRRSREVTARARASIRVAVPLVAAIDDAVGPFRRMCSRTAGPAATPPRCPRSLACSSCGSWPRRSSRSATAPSFRPGRNGFRASCPIHNSSPARW